MRKLFVFFRQSSLALILSIGIIFGMANYVMAENEITFDTNYTNSSRRELVNSIRNYVLPQMRPGISKSEAKGLRIRILVHFDNGDYYYDNGTGKFTPVSGKSSGSNKKVSYKVSFNPNKGKLADNAKSSKTVTNGNKYGSLPKATRKNYAFLGWFTKKSGGNKITKSTKVLLGKDKTLYAHWGYKVKFNPNGGKVKTKSKNYEKNAVFGNLPTPTKSGFSFAGWYTKKKGGTLIGKKSKCSKNISLYAHWGYKVILVPNGGRLTQFSVIEVPGEKYRDLPTPRKAGFIFDGWYTAQNGGEKVINNQSIVKIKKNSSLYARWIKGNPQIEPEKKLGDIDKYDDLSVPFSKEHYDILKDGGIDYREGYFVFTKDNKSFAINRKALYGDGGRILIRPNVGLSPMNSDIALSDILVYKIGNLWTFAQVNTWSRIINNNQIEIRIVLKDQLNFWHESGDTITKRSTVFHISSNPGFFFHRDSGLVGGPQTLINPTIIVSEIPTGNAVFDTEKFTTQGLSIGLADPYHYLTIAKDTIDLVYDIYSLKTWSTVKDTIEFASRLFKPEESIYTSNRTIDISEEQDDHIQIIDPHTLILSTTIGLGNSEDYCESIIQFDNNTKLTTEEFTIQYLVNSVSPR